MRAEVLPDCGRAVVGVCGSVMIVVVVVVLAAVGGGRWYVLRWRQFPTDWILGPRSYCASCFCTVL